MTRRQFVFLVALNALVSLLISVGVVLTLGRAVFAPQQIAVSTGTQAAPESAATPEPSLTPELPGVTPTKAGVESTRPSVYVVKEGDPLWQIAARFGVSVEDLMRVNGLGDPNLIRPGQELIIPGENLPPPTPTPTVPFEPPTPAFTPIGGPEHTPTPTIPPAFQGKEGVYIEAAMNPGEPGREAILIRNTTKKLHDLAGWKLETDLGHRYIFPDLLLWPQGIVVVYTGSGTNTPTELYWGLDGPILAGASELRLYDRAGELVNSYSLR